MPSFSVRCIFLWDQRPDQARKHVYKERITVWHANDIDAAIALAETEAGHYAEDSGVEYLQYCQAYAMFDDAGASGIEVFSVLRDSDLEPEQYLDAFFDTDGEHERTTSP